MKLQSLIVLFLALFECCVATGIVLKDVVLSFDSRTPSIQLDQVDIDSKAKSNETPVSLSETLTLSFETEDELSQANILVGVPSKGLEAGYTLKKKNSGDHSKYVANVPLSKYAGTFEGFSQLAITVLTANEETSLVKEIFQLNINTTETQSTSSKKANRFGPLDEIHHVFQQPPKTVNAFIAQVFSAIIAGALLVLLAAWVGFGVISFNLKSVSSYVFVALISGFEFIFYKYYFGSSIFDTLFKASLLLLPALLFGSATLKSFKH